MPLDRSEESSRSRSSGVVVATILERTFMADVEFWIAFSWVLGSISWVSSVHKSIFPNDYVWFGVIAIVINFHSLQVMVGYLEYLPLLHPSHAPQQYQTAAWGLLGGTLFQIGSYLKFLEPSNLHNHGFVPSIGALLEAQPESTPRGRTMLSNAADDKSIVIGTRPSRDLGYLASTIQLVAATIFWAGTMTCLPEIVPNFLNVPLKLNLSSETTNALFWTGEIIGSCGFLVSSVLYMLEEQTTWRKPNLRSVGW